MVSKYNTELVFAYWTEITATNQQLSKFLMMLGWQRSHILVEISPNHGSNQRASHNTFKALYFKLRDHGRRDILRSNISVSRYNILLLSSLTRSVGLFNQFFPISIHFFHLCRCFLSHLASSFFCIFPLNNCSSSSNSFFYSYFYDLFNLLFLYHPICISKPFQLSFLIHIW